MKIYISKLKGSYPTAAPADWIIGKYAELDPVFAGRLAYMAQSTGTKIKLTEGYRSTARQQELYNMYLEYRRTGKGSIKLAAKPGTSWHEFRLAVDTSTQPVRSWSDKMLHSFGLCKPISSEGWHIQPIETKGQSNKQAFAPIEEEREDEEEMKIYENIEELSGDWKLAVKWAIDKGILKGNGKTLGVSESDVKTIVFLYRDNVRRKTE